MTPFDRELQRLSIAFEAGRIIGQQPYASMKDRPAGLDWSPLITAWCNGFVIGRCELASVGPKENASETQLGSHQITNSRRS